MVQKINQACSVQLDIKEVFNIKYAEEYLSDIRIELHRVENLQDEFKKYGAICMLEAYIKVFKDYCNRYNVDYNIYLNKIGLSQKILKGRKVV